MVKKLTKITLACVVVLFQSCGYIEVPEPEQIWYLLVNKTNHKMELEVYDSENRVRQYTLIVDSFFVTQVQYKDTIPNPFSPFNIIRLKYDDTISVWFSDLCEYDSFNINDKRNYKMGFNGSFSKADYEYEYEYDFTEKDYQYALLKSNDK